jgi:putative flippase GtrA
MTTNETQTFVPRRAVGLVPAFKPDQALITLTRELLEQNVLARIVCVNDGSGQQYEPIFEKLISIGVEVIPHYVNLGKGMALRTGLNAICAQPDPPDTIVTFDADGQHTLEDIQKIAILASEKPGALTLGVREMDNTAPFRSRFGNNATRHVLRFFTGIRLKDTQTGLRAIPRSLVPALLNQKSVGYEFELDMLIEAQKRKVPIYEVDIRTVYLDGNSSSHFNPFFDSLKIYFVFIRYSASSICAAALDFMVFALAQLAGMPLATSLILGRGVGASFQFTATKGFVFNSAGTWIRYLLKYCLILVILTALSYLGIAGLQHYFRLSPYLAKLLVEGCIFFISFTLLRDWVFSAVSDKSV